MNGNLNSKKALEVVEAIEPRAIMQMGAEGPSDIVKELGAESVEAEELDVVVEAATVDPTVAPDWFEGETDEDSDEDSDEDA